MYGRIRTQYGLDYQVTPEDALWLARAVECEGGDQVSSAWTMIWRFAYFRRGRGTLAQLVRSFSQPVNPRWESPTSPGCVQYPGDCSPDSLARRAQCRSLEWSQMRHAALVQAVLRAEIPNPVPRAINFADARVSLGYVNRTPGAWVIYAKGGNWYLGENQSANLPFDAVWIEYNGRRSGVEPYPDACTSFHPGCRPIGRTGPRGKDPVYPPSRRLVPPPTAGGSGGGGGVVRRTGLPPAVVALGAVVFAIGAAWLLFQEPRR